MSHFKTFSAFILFLSFVLISSWQACGQFKSKSFRSTQNHYDSLSSESLRNETQGTLEITVGEKFEGTDSKSPPQSQTLYSINTPNGKLEISPEPESLRNSAFLWNSLQSGMTAYVETLTSQTEPALKVKLYDQNSKSTSTKDFKLTVKSTAKSNNPHLGNQKTLVARMRGAYEYPYPVITNEAMSTRVFHPKARYSLNEIFNKNSFGKTTFSGEVVGPLWGPKCLDGKLEEIFQSTIAQLNEKPEYKNRLNEYDRLVILIPQNSGCDGWNWGTIGKTKRSTKAGLLDISVTWMYEWTQDSDFGFILAHEMGHNIGLHHANHYTCSDGNLISNVCSSQTYQDTEDLMGGPWGLILKSFSVARKEQVGWLNEQNSQWVETGTATLYNGFAQPQSQTQHIKVPLQYGKSALANGLFYLSLEYKKFNSNIVGTLYDGVYIKYVSLRGGSYLPIFPQEKNVLKVVGDSFVDKVNGKKITLDGFVAEGARVRIENVPQTVTPPLRTVTTLQSPNECSSLEVEFERLDGGQIQNIYSYASEQIGPETQFNNLANCYQMQDLGSIRKCIYAGLDYDYRKPYAVFGFVDDVFSQSMKEPLNCNRPFPSLAITKAQGINPTDFYDLRSCQGIEIEARVENMPPNTNINYKVFLNELPYGQVGECNSPINQNSSYCEVNNLNPNINHSVATEVYVNFAGRQYGLMSFADIPSWNCSTAQPKKDLLAVNGLKYGWSDFCTMTGVDVVARNIPDGEMVEFVAKDPQNNEVSTCQVPLRDGGARCIMMGLSPNTRYVIMAKYENVQTYLFRETRPNCP